MSKFLNAIQALTAITQAVESAQTTGVPVPPDQRLTALETGYRQLLDVTIELDRRVDDLEAAVKRLQAKPKAEPKPKTPSAKG